MNEKTSVVFVNGNKFTSYGSGNTEIITKSSNGEAYNITLKNVLYVPEIEINLFCVSKVKKNGFKILSEKDTCNLTFNGITCLKGQRKIIYTKFN